MPDPINASGTSSVQGVFPESGCSSEADDCDPSVASCQARPETKPQASIVVPEVLIEGEAGASELARAYSESRAARIAASCSGERGELANGCGVVPLSAAGALLTAPTGVGFVVGSSLAVAAAGNCGRLLAEYYNCQEREAAIIAIEQRCEARGGVALAGSAGNEVVCLVTK